MPILLGVQVIEVVVETPRGSRNKYEIEEDSGRVWLDRRLPGAFAFPADYGYVPGALGSDGEPLDAVVLALEPTYPGVRVRARLIGVFLDLDRARTRGEADLRPRGRTRIHRD
jgi:inorganic pyrophosphatase